MYDPSDTIVAVSSASVPVGAAGGAILRLSGPEAFGVVGQVAGEVIEPRRGVRAIRLQAGGIACEAFVYGFPGPHSYTGEDSVEIHLTAPGPFVEQVYEQLLALARPAAPGEFTCRAYLGGRMDLSQAEAVAQIVSGSNTVHLAAAEKLLAGSLARAVAAVRDELLELLSLLEAGLDFCEEGIEFVAPDEARRRVEAVRDRLTSLLDGPVAFERLIDLPAVGIAGAVNAGKSTLLNALLGRVRSITSGRGATTRDVLSEVLRLDETDCVLFDCAGLSAGDPLDELDAMAQQAARSALGAADLVLFCVDITKEDLGEDEAVFALVRERPCIPVAAQCDRLSAGQVREKAASLHSRFGRAFLPVSAQGGEGLAELKSKIARRLLSDPRARSEADGRLALNQRHRRILQEAVKSLAECAEETGRGNTEIAAMLLRAVRGSLGGVEHESVDESVLEQIFSRFCIGK